MKQFVAETYSLLLSQKFFSKKRIVYSFSGGQDSTIVFFVLFHFHRKKFSQTSNLLYCHHFWQIQNFQASKGIFHFSFNVKVPYTIIMSNLSLSNENRSRNWRKKNLFRFCTLQNSSIIITGHTQTDKVETNFNNLVRGTSSKGLSSTNFLQEHGETIFQRTQNSRSSGFSLLIFSTSFVVLKLLTQPKQVRVVKKFGLKSKIFFSNVTAFSEKSVYPVLPNRVFKQSKIATKLSQSDNQAFSKSTMFPRNKFVVMDKPKNYQTDFTFKIKGIFLWIHQDQLLEVKNKSDKFQFWEQKESLLSQNSQNFQKIKSFSLWLRNKSFIRKSNSFCFSKFSEKRIINLKTPLQNQTRVSVSKLAEIYSLPIFHDLTNFSCHSSRNKIRHIVFPLIGFLFKKKVEVSLTQFFSTLRDETFQSQNSYQKIYFLLDFFSISLVTDSNLAETTKWSVFGKENKTNSFENILLLYVAGQSKTKCYSYMIKKIMRNYTERELSFNQIVNLQKIQAL